MCAFLKKFLFSKGVFAILWIVAGLIFVIEGPRFIDYIDQLKLSLSSTSVVQQKCNAADGLDWITKNVNDYTLENIIKYLEWTNESSCRLSQNFGGSVIYSVGMDGQKAVCLDSTVRPIRASDVWPIKVKEEFSECLVYSFGINNDWTFDEAMESFGCRVYAFDPSMNLSNHYHSSKIQFFKIGLSDRCEHSSTKKNNWPIESLDSIYYNLLRHQGRIIDYLKIDIESDEWIVLPQILSSGMMDKVRQLGVEIHIAPSENNFLRDLQQRVKVLKSLEDYGFVRFYSKLNPFSYALNYIDNTDWFGYNSYEIAWFNFKHIRKPVNDHGCPSQR
jgi:hypothetical protein